MRSLKLIFLFCFFAVSQITLANHPIVVIGSGIATGILKEFGEFIARTPNTQMLLEKADSTIRELTGYTAPTETAKKEQERAIEEAKRIKLQLVQNKTPDLPLDQRQKIIDYIVKLQPPVDSKNSNLQINFAYRSQHKGALKPLTNEMILKSGDSYKITVNPKQDSHLYIFQIDSSNQIFSLFPMKAFNGVVVNNFNPIKANVTQILPKDNLSFSLDNKTGTEKIYVFVSQIPDAELQKLAENQTIQVAQFEQITKTRGLGSILVDPNETLELKGDNFSQPNSTLPISHLDGLCNQKASGCAYVLSFKHE